jgi:phosphoglycerate kinase
MTDNSVLSRVAKELSKLLGHEITFVSDCIGEGVKGASLALQPGQVLLLENLRYYKEEKANDENFAQAIIDSTGAEVFVQDGFGVVHRAHASTDALARKLPALAGLLLEQEITTLTRVMTEPERPLMAIIGGAKIADKIEIIHRFIDMADIVAVGGAMANTFLMAQGIEVGESLVEQDELDTAHEIMEKVRQVSKQRPFVFYLPQDGVVSTAVDNRHTTRIVDWDAHVIAAIESYPGRPSRSAGKVLSHEKLLDIGPFSGAFIAGSLQLVKTAIWNGTMGVSEIEPLHGTVGPFAHGTEAVIDGLVGKYGNRPFSVVGGGDTTAYIEERGLTDMFHHVSTGGGASLELMAGRELPGVQCLWEKD